MPPVHARSSRPDTTGFTPRATGLSPWKFCRICRGFDPCTPKTRRSSNCNHYEWPCFWARIQRPLLCVQAQSFCHMKTDHLGSLSLNEFFKHGGTTRKIREMNNRGHKKFKTLGVSQAGKNMRGRITAIMYMLPLAHICCNSNQSFLARAEYEPGKLANPASWFKPSVFERDGKRMAQADLLEGLDVASAFLRFKVWAFKPIYGSTCQVFSKHVPKYLVHETNEKNLPSIRRLGLLPGGTRVGRQDVYFALDCSLTTMQDSLRPE